MGETSVDLFADRFNTQKSQVCQLEAGHKCNSSGCSRSTMAGNKRLCVPSILPKSLAKVQKEGVTIIIITPTWQSQVW